MEITKEIMEKIYEKLNNVSPVNYDCGKRCNEICCIYDSEDYRNDELIIYLLPGEELMYDSSKSFELMHYDIEEINYPYSWKDGVYTGIGNN